MADQFATMLSEYKRQNDANLKKWVHKVCAKVNAATEKADRQREKQQGVKRKKESSKKTKGEKPAKRPKKATEGKKETRGKKEQSTKGKGKKSKAKSEPKES